MASKKKSAKSKSSKQVLSQGDIQILAEYFELLYEMEQAIDKRDAEAKLVEEKKSKNS